MAFPLIQYQPSSEREYPFNNFISNILGGYEKTMKNRILPEDLIKKQLENKWYEPNIQSEIGLRKAQTGEAGARTGLIGEQTKGAHIENKYMDEYKRAQIDQLKAQAEKARLLQMIREHMMGGGMQGGQMPQDSSPFMQMYQGKGMPSQQQVPQQPQMGNMPSYAQAAIAGQALGLGMPKIIEANGKYIALSPFGAIDTGVKGLNEQQKSLAKEDAKKISKLEDVVLNSQPMTDNLNSLNEILSNEQFEVLRKNPILGKHELGWYKKFGTKQQQDLISQAQTFMGNIIKASARDFPGQFRIGEQALLNDMKPNESDTLDSMKGKSAALTYLNTIMSKRAELEADYMRNYGMSSLQARIAADKQINPAEIKKEIHTILHPASSKKGHDITPDEALAELKRRQAAGSR